MQPIVNGSFCAQQALTALFFLSLSAWTVAAAASAVLQDFRFLVQIKAWVLAHIMVTGGCQSWCGYQKNKWYRRVDPKPCLL